MVHIRARRTEDIPALNRILNQASTSRFTRALPFTSVAQSTEFFNNLPASAHVLVACDENGQVLGCADLGVHPSPRCAHVASLGIMVAEAARRQGVGHALMTAILDLADKWLNMKRVDLIVNVNNDAAIALYQQFGFEVEARLRRYDLQDGALADCYIMARLQQRLVIDQSPPPPLPPRQELSQDVSLRALEPGDAASYAELRQQPSDRHFMLALPYRPSVDEAEARLASVSGENQMIGAFTGEQLVGVTFLNVGSRRHRHSAEIITMKVHDEFHGQGIARKLLHAVLDVADNWLGLKRVGLYVCVDNQRAIELYQSAGFEVEGRLQADNFRNGGYADVLVMSRLR